MKKVLIIVGAVIAGLGLLGFIGSLMGAPESIPATLLFMLIGGGLLALGIILKPSQKKPAEKKPAPAAPAARPVRKVESEDDEDGEVYGDDGEDQTPTKYKYSRRPMYSKNAVNKFREEHRAYVVLGIATTGTDKYDDKIVDIALLRVLNGRDAGSFRSYVNPHCKIPADATKVNGITDATVRKAPVPVRT